MENYFWPLELQKKTKNISFSSILFSIFFWVPSRFFRFFSAIFFFFHLHVKSRFLSVGVKLAGMHHKPIFIKSRDGCPEFEKLRNKKYLWIGVFFRTKKIGIFCFFHFRNKKALYRANWWPVARNKVKKTIFRNRALLCLGGVVVPW